MGAVTGSKPQSLLAASLPSLQGAVRDMVIDGVLLRPSTGTARASMGADVCAGASSALPCPDVGPALVLNGTAMDGFERVGSGSRAYWRSNDAASDASAVAFVLPASAPTGVYDLALSYESVSESASNAVMRVLPPTADASSTAVHTFYVNQRSPPIRPVADSNGRVFTSPVRVSLSAGAQIVLSVTGADGVVTARAVRLQQVGPDGCLL